jgi:hypothetical protein
MKFNQAQFGSIMELLWNYGGWIIFLLVIKEIRKWVGKE